MNKIYDKFQPGSLVAQLVETRAKAGALGDKLEERSGRTATQALILAALPADGANQSTLVSRTGIDRSTMTDVLQRLARLGLISRKRSGKDRRSMIVKLTEKGLAEALKIRALA